MSKERLTEMINIGKYVDKYNGPFFPSKFLKTHMAIESKK